jgi:hypothetical protein
MNQTLRHGSGRGYVIGAFQVIGLGHTKASTCISGESERLYIGPCSAQSVTQPSQLAGLAYMASELLCHAQVATPMFSIQQLVEEKVELVKMALCSHHFKAVITLRPSSL